MIRTPVKKRRSKPRRGRVIDKKRITWAKLQPCQITGESAATTHHVREFGSPKNDKRIIRLAARLHMKTNAVPGTPCVEDSKELFEKFHGVEIESLVAELNRLYEGKC